MALRLHRHDRVYLLLAGSGVDQKATLEVAPLEDLHEASEGRILAVSRAGHGARNL